MTLLMTAARDSRVDAAQKLLDSGADVAEQDQACSFVNVLSKFARWPDMPSTFLR